MTNGDQKSEIAAYLVPYKCSHEPVREVLVAGSPALEAVRESRQACLSEAGVYVHRPDGARSGLSEGFYTGILGSQFLKDLTGLRLGQHADAIAFLARYGDWYSRATPEGAVVPCFNREREPFVDEDISRVSIGGAGFHVVWPSAWWCEWVLMSRAIWLHHRITTGKTKDLALVSGDTYRSIRWPKSLRLSWASPSDAWMWRTHHDDWLRPGSSCGPFTAATMTPEVFLWSSLVALINDGQRRCPRESRLVFDIRRSTVVRTEPTGMLGSAIWELIARKALEAKAPVFCPVCGKPVQAKRSTRIFCDDPNCRQTARRQGLLLSKKG